MNNRSEIHVTNQNGERKVINRNEYNKIQMDIHEDANAEYFFDADWYLSNGCMTLDEMFLKIENNC